MLTVYYHPRCTTCKKGLAYLRRHNVPHQTVDLTETGPTKAELGRMLKELETPRKIFNTSGKRYRELNIKESRNSMSMTAIAELLASEPLLVKRPFLLGTGIALIGFNEAEWDAAFRS